MEMGRPFRRELFLDADCYATVEREMCQTALKNYRGFAKPAHRADLWRYGEMLCGGGAYVDIKIALLQDLHEKLIAKQEELRNMLGMASRLCYYSNRNNTCHTTSCNRLVLVVVVVVV